MDEPPNPDQTPASPDPLEGDSGTRSAMIATLDQHSAEIDALQAQTLILMFALGALAGLLFVMHREVRALALPD